MNVNFNKRRFRTVLSITLLLASFSTALSQEFSWKELPINISYYGESGIHPGLKIGTSYYFIDKEVSKERKLNSRQDKLGNKVKQKVYSLDYNLGFYSHPNNHTGLFTGIGITSYKTKMRVKKRSQKKKYFVTGYSFEVGYLRRFLKFDTFELDDNGDIKKVKGTGSNSLVFSITPMILGKEYRPKSGARMRLFFKPTLQILKYNHSFTVGAVGEIGLTLNLNKINSTNK